MAKRLWFFWCLTLTLVGSFSCEKIVGIEKKQLVAEADAGPCAVVSPTGIGLRFANLITTDQKIDVCVRPAGAAYPTLPLLKGGGSNCPDGVGYGQYTMPLKIDAGKYDIKFVPAGSTCDTDGPSALNVDITASQSTSVMAYGKSPAAADSKATALVDATDRTNNVYIRLFHAENGEGPVDGGLAGSSPTTVGTISQPAFHNVSFGSVAAKYVGTLSVDDLGYMVYENTGNDPGALPMAVGSTGSADYFLSITVRLTKAHHYGLFLMGTAGDTGSYKPKLWSCDEGVPTSDGFFAECGDPRDLKISIFHPNLTDFFTDYVQDRATTAIESIASTDADLLCVPELYAEELRKSLADRLTSTFNLTLSDTMAASSDSDLTDQLGRAVTWPDPACANELATDLATLRDCLLSLPCVGAESAGDASVAKHYFGVPGSAAIGCVGGALGTSCIDQIGVFPNLGSHAADECLMCAITHLSSGESFEDMYSACTTQNGGKPHYVYGGTTGLALISNAQLTIPSDESPEVVALPASNWNRAALRVPLKLQNNALVDVWCAEVRAPNNEVFIQNGGPYYGDAAAGDAFATNSAEERLQIERLIAAVNARAAASGRRAIVLALTYASPSITDSKGKELVTGLVPENFALFQQSPTPWNELVAPSWVPACTWCGDNPLNSPGENEGIVHMFGVGIGADTVTETTRTFVSNAVEVTFYADQTSHFTPISQYYGLQSTVRVSQ